MDGLEWCPVSGGWLQVNWMTWLLSASSNPLALPLQMVTVTEFPRATRKVRPQRTRPFQASACVIFANVPSVKASHVGSPDSRCREMGSASNLFL